MLILTPGHKYVCANFENPTHGQTIQFIEKEPLVVGSPELRTVADGTTNEEVLAMLIDRMGHLQAKFPCGENEAVLFNLKEALRWLEYRTESRKRRGIEGKNL
jgi:hypothetical protein